MVRLLTKTRTVGPLRSPRFSVDCPFCGDAVIRQEREELVFRARVIKFPVSDGSRGVAKCKTCKRWVDVPVTLHLK